ncbi:MAG: SDR family oxidoreductase [Alphaproteobacteria bacterium]|nr:SDR family oxidoreductase [Alphaproteobacteria bacterium]MBM4115536.1 SDR family oxidoreductase [Phycisphaerae bacterium]
MRERFAMDGRVALITGASLSIGRALALAFAEHGADIALHHAAAADAAYGWPEAAAETAQECSGRGARVTILERDLAEPGAGRAVVEGAIAALGRVDILVIGASIQYRGAFATITPAQVARQVAINFQATIDLLQAALPPMASRGWGRVVTIGSINQMRPEPELAVYAALKDAQKNLCLNLARSYAAQGVTLNNLAPGLIATERNRWRRADAEAWTRIAAKASPTGRAGTPEDLVGAALLLCSEAGAYIAGADLMVTGAGHLPGW